MFGVAAQEIIAVILPRGAVDDHLLDDQAAHLGQTFRIGGFKHKAVKRPVAFDEAIDIGALRTMHRHSQAVVACTQRIQLLRRDQCRGAASGVTFEHRPQGEYFVDLTRRPIGHEAALGVAPAHQHFRFQPLKRLADRGSRDPAHAGQLFLFKLRSRRQIARQYAHADFAIGGV